jgi:hypothetical protein
MTKGVNRQGRGPEPAGSGKTDHVEFTQAVDEGQQGEARRLFTDIETFAGQKHQVIQGNRLHLFEQLPQHRAGAVEIVVGPGVEIQKHAGAVIKRGEDSGSRFNDLHRR